MPCCAFAAFIVSQIALALAALKARLLGRSADHNPSESRSNAAVDWRLFGNDAGAAPPRVEAHARGRRRGFGRMPARGWIFVAAVETAIVLGAAYGFGSHPGHLLSGIAGHHRVQASARHVSTPPLPH